MRPLLKTLRRRFLATLILIGAIPFVVTGLVLLNLQNRTLHEQASRELTTLANGAATKLETFVREMENDARAMAALPAMVAMQPADQQTLFHALFQQYQRYAQFGVADPVSGQLLVLEPPKALVSIAHVPSFQAAAKGQQQSVIFPALAGNQLILHMHTPIWNASNQVVGVFGSPVPLPNLAAILQENCPPGGNAYLLDPTGKIVVQAKTQDLPADLDYAAALGFPPGQLPATPGAATYQLQGAAQLASYAPVTSFGWMVVTDVPESTVLAPTLRALGFAGIGLLASLALSIVAAVLLSKSLTSPVRQLADAARALGQGDTTPFLPPTASASDEIHTLVSAFQNMRHAVTQREESLRQSESRNRALVAAIPDALLRIGRDGTILDVHIPAATILPFLQPDLIGRNFASAITHLQPQAAADQLIATFERARQSRQAETVEVALTHPGGTLDLEARFSLGSDEEILLILRDLSAQKLLEAAERKYSAALEALNDGLATLDADLQYTYVNNAYAAMHGCRSADLRYRSVYTAYGAAEQIEITQAVLPTVRKRGSWRGEINGLRYDGSSFVQELACIQLETGEFVWIVRDVTERKEAERALQQAQKLESLGVLAGGVAHDFNNLLAVILGNAALAQLKLESHSPLQKYVSLISDSAQRASDLTRQLLAYAGKEQFLVESIQLAQLIQENRALLETTMPRRAELVVDLPIGLPAIMADRGQIQQVLMNLVINAAEALGESGGKVTIQAFSQQLTARAIAEQRWMGNTLPEPSEYLCLQVADDGAGIAPADIERIFDPFFTTKSYGRGLGLSATLGIIRGQKGSIQVESQVGVGSRFCVFFPAAAQRLAPVVEKLAPLPQHSGVALVIDDEENVRQITGEMLETLGFQVLGARNGWEGLEIFQSHRGGIDLILLDMKMPVMDGVETYRRLSAIDNQIPVIFSSGYSESEAVIQTGSAQKRVAYLRKPYLPATLAAKISEILPT